MAAAKRVPSYRLHKASGQAVVTIDGRDHYLGRYDSPDSHEAYGRTIAAWKAGTLGSLQRTRAPQGPTVAAVVVAFLEAVEKAGRYTKGGKPTSERLLQARAMRPLVKLFGGTLAASFGPLDLVTVRAALCHRPAKEKPAAGHWRHYEGPPVRTSINTMVRRIVRVFRWAASVELVPASTWQALRAVEGLRRGESSLVKESPGVRAVSPRAVALVLRKIDARAGTMIRLQWLSGMRPGEVCRLRWCDVDRRAAVWVFRPTLHKTEHHGRDRLVMLGPRCQRLLAPYLDHAPDAWLFPGRGGGHLSPARYRRLIDDACDEAGIPRWSPNQLRHAAATRARTSDGIEVAGILLGHANIATTQVYAERDLRKAMAFAQAHG
jgi:integrase